MSGLYGIAFTWGGFAAAAIGLSNWAMAGCSQAPCQSAMADGPRCRHAAGSLREAFTEIARDHEARTGQKVVLTFAASRAAGTH